MITTIYGDMDEALLTKREGVDEDDRARAEWVEYWKDEELVHRSVHVALKKGVEFNLEQGQWV
jgi:hypothetical protein